MVIAPVRRGGDPGSNPGQGEDFSLKLLINNNNKLYKYFNIDNKYSLEQFNA